MIFSIPNAVELITAAKPILKRGRWGDGKAAVCMMSALQPGAKSDDDCVTAGWPEWLSVLNHQLFDASVGGDEDAAAFQFALSVAEAIQVPRDYDKHLYKDRKKVEWFINLIKQYRRVATRYEKTARNFLGFVHVASILVLLR